MCLVCFTSCPLIRTPVERRRPARRALRAVRWPDSWPPPWSRLKNIRSCPTAWPNGERRTAASTSGVRPTSHTEMPRSFMRASPSASILSDGVLHVEHGAQVQHDDPGLSLLDQQPDLLRHPLAVDEEQPAHGAQHQRPESLVVGILGRERAEHARPRLRPSRYTGGSATCCASDTREMMIATRMPLRVPSSMTPAKAATAQMNSVRRTARIARNSGDLNQPDRVDDHHRRQRRLRHQADQRREEQQRQERRAARDQAGQLAARARQAVHGGLGRAAARRHAAEQRPAGRCDARRQQLLVRRAAAASPLCANARPAADVSVKLMSAMPRAPGHSCAMSEKSGSVRAGRPRGISPTVSTP